MSNDANVPLDHYSSPLDPGIARYVHILEQAGVATYESCQGGEGHASPYPMVFFRGNYSEGLAALATALQHKLPVFALQRVWRLDDGEMTGPWWELRFHQGPVN